jgi:dolichyldiphosphatase
MNGKGYGMPSSHAQFVAYFSFSLSLFLLLRHQPHPLTTRTPLSFSIRALISLLAIACACLVATSRIYLNYHTPKQVLVGFVAGIAFAIVWFTFTSVLRRTGILHAILDTELLRMGRWRDLVVEEDLQDPGWVKWEERRHKRSVPVEIYRRNAENGIQEKKKRR